MLGKDTRAFGYNDPEHQGRWKTIMAHLPLEDTTG